MRSFLEKAPLIRLRTSTAIIALSLGSLAVWFNIEEHSYLANTPAGWAGGSRHGFPFTYWEGGVIYTGMRNSADRMTVQPVVRAEKYARFYWERGLCNLILSGLVVGLVIWACERSARQGSFSTACSAKRSIVSYRLSGVTLFILLSSAALTIGFNLTPNFEITPLRTAVGTVYVSDAIYGWPFDAVSHKTYITSSSVVVLGWRCLLNLTIILAMLTGLAYFCRWNRTSTKTQNRL